MELIFLALAWLLAVASVALWNLPAWTVGTCLLTVAPAAYVLCGRRWALWLAAMAVLALAGSVRFDHWQHRDLGSLSHYVERSVVIEGRILSEPTPGETSTSFIFEADQLTPVDGPPLAVSGKLRLSLDQYADYLPGTRLRLTGKLGDPPVFADFDYRQFLARSDIVATMSGPGVEVLQPPPRWQVRRNVTEFRLLLDRALQRTLPEPEASLAGGVAFGRDGNLPDDLYDEFRDTGLAHIVAVSGSNVSLVTALTFLLFTWLIGRRRALWPAGFTVLAYLLVAGLSASVVRAGVMAMVFLVGNYLGRPQSSLAALGFAAIAMVAAQPQAAQDLGFQLSLAATAGLIVFGPWIRYGLDRASGRYASLRFVHGAIQVASLSAAASLATLPIVWVNFGRVSLLGPLANIVIEPLFVVAFWLSIAVAAAGAIWPPAGWAIGLFAYYPLSFVTSFARIAGSLPFAAVDVPPLNGTVAFSAYTVLAVVGWFAYRRYAPTVPAGSSWRARRQPSWRLLLAGGACVVAAIVLPMSILSMRSSDIVRMTLLDTGDGDAVLFTTPHGRHVVVDGGRSGIVLVRELGAVLPHWERRIDAVFVLQAQADHAGAIPAVLERFDVGRVLATDGISFEQAPAPATLHTGNRFELDGVLFEILVSTMGTPDAAANGQAAVLLVSYRGVRFLLPADLSARSQADLMAATSVSATVLVVPHNGANKTDAPFLQAVHPFIALVPVGTSRFAGHPNETSVQALGGAKLFRTDEDGRITIRTDGHRLTFETAR